MFSVKFLTMILILSSIISLTFILITSLIISLALILIISLTFILMISLTLIKTMFMITSSTLTVNTIFIMTCIISIDFNLIFYYVLADTRSNSVWKYYHFHSRQTILQRFSEFFERYLDTTEIWFTSKLSRGCSRLATKFSFFPTRKSFGWHVALKIVLTAHFTPLQKSTRVEWNEYSRSCTGAHPLPLERSHVACLLCLRFHESVKKRMRVLDVVCIFS